MSRTISFICVFVAFQLGSLGQTADQALGQTQESDCRYRLRMLAADKAGGGDAAISPDGQRFIISSKRAGTYDLWVYDIAAARWDQLTKGAADEFEARWSPDGTRVVFTGTKNGNKDIFVITSDGRDERQLTYSQEDDEYPAWSPDGKQIVYTGGPWNSRDFFLVPAEGGQPLKLTRQSGQAGACSFHPDGKSVVCHGYDEGSGDIFLISLKDGQVSPLTSGAAWDYKPSISPDGEWVAFSRSAESASAIYLMSLRGGNPKRLTFTNSDDRWPVWDASGKRLFFHRLAERGVAIRVLDTITGNVKTVVNAIENPMQASFDPTGRHIVYSAEESGRRVLKILDLLGGATRILNTGHDFNNFPRWSPDGKQIAFVSKDFNRWEISTINIDGTNCVTWTEANGQLKGMYGPLDWSPDGSKLVFKADTKPFESDIWMLDMRSGKVRKLTDDSWFDESPSWTADGKGILFMSTRGGNWTWGLYRLSLTDGSVAVIASPDYIEKNYPRMSKKGWVTWSAYDKQGVEKIAQKAPRGKASILSRAGSGGRWPSYSANGRFLLFTVLERRVEYWLAENLLSPGSPLVEAPPSDLPSPRAANYDLGHPEGMSSRTSPAVIRISPVNTFHR
ncbi:MAG TPA: DPP IV N-terminal domain-containing protein [Blastocatellia bacterium]|nr:DPP IV N-terminal domain-containing protein [Blastocatellia bacterium]